MVIIALAGCYGFVLLTLNWIFYFCVIIRLVSVGNLEAAVTLLLSTPPESSHFYANALRAVALSSAVSRSLHELAVKVNMKCLFRKLLLTLLEIYCDKIFFCLTLSGNIVFLILYNLSGGCGQLG